MYVTILFACLLSELSWAIFVMGFQPKSKCFSIMQGTLNEISVSSY